VTDARDIARTVKGEWEARARSKDREFFVASHVGWDREEERERQGAADAAAFLRELPGEMLSDADLLEVGCGSGRLARHIAPLVRTYTGVDISATMVDVARERCRGFPNARFLESDGPGLPEGARDRRYQVAIAVAVFIHCPKDLCDLLARATVSQLADGGRFRVQLRADPEDLEGIVPGDGQSVVDANGRVLDIVTPEQAAMIAGSHYGGHAFRYREACEWFQSLGAATVLRLDPMFVYGEVRNSRG
jgi:SAM-dependent methyltransferase